MSRLEQLHKLLQDEPNDTFLNYSLAMEFRQTGQTDEALAQFQKLNELDPDYVPAYFMQGQMLIVLDRREEAKAILNQGIEVAQRIGDGHAVAEMTETLQAIG